MMNKDFKNVHQALVELADLKLQRKLWLNQNNDTGLISSYSELMCSLFDDFGFDEFIDNGASAVGFSDSFIHELVKLRMALNYYEEKETDKKILDDPKWKKITEQAQMVIHEWGKI